MIEFILFLILAAVGLLTLGYLLVRVIILAVLKRQTAPTSKLGMAFMHALNGVAVLIAIYSLTFFILSKIKGPQELYVDIRYGHFYRHMVARELDQAYQIMSPHYRESHSLSEFTQEYSFVPDYNPFPGRFLKINGHKATYYPGFDHWPMNGPVYEWIMIDDWWYLAEFNWSLD